MQLYFKDPFVPVSLLTQRKSLYFPYSLEEFSDVCVMEETSRTQLPSIHPHAIRNFRKVPESHSHTTIYLWQQSIHFIHKLFSTHIEVKVFLEIPNIRLNIYSRLSSYKTVLFCKRVHWKHIYIVYDPVIECRFLRIIFRYNKMYTSLFLFVHS